MPKGTAEEKAARAAKMQEGLKEAVQAPLQTMRLADQAWEAMCEAARYSSMGFKSDVQVGARALETGIWGAYQNVLINLDDIKNQEFKDATLKEAGAINQRATDKCAEVLAILELRED